MVLNFDLNLKQAKKEIKYSEQREFIIYENEEVRTYETSDEWLEKFAAAQHAIVDLLNKKYKLNIDLQNWVKGDTTDEVSSFLNEASSNCFANAQYKCVWKMVLYLGDKGFILGVFQKGKGFNAKEINTSKKKENVGKGFDFYRECKNVIFFDDPKDATTLFFSCSFEPLS
ncbi:hypothetical protein CL620_01440 [archaeon]|nr:hypothetical protein [archaeon]|tara:strand:+ start:333 stop:845 length:513 start_codon:yes stop_codon:yes gene_type:complete